MSTHQNLVVWKQSIDFVTDIYSVTKSFPKEELYGITNQIRRAAVSIPVNIAEGAARNSVREFLRFLNISLGSISEIETLLIIVQKIGLGGTNELEVKLVEIRKKLLNLIKYLKTRLN